jgi:chromosomal replication initiation ATPase DnaA
MIDLETIQFVLAESFGMPLDEVKQGMLGVVALPRQIAVYLSTIDSRIFTRDWTRRPRS